MRESKIQLIFYSFLVNDLIRILMTPCKMFPNTGFLGHSGMFYPVWFQRIVDNCLQTFEISPFPEWKKLALASMTECFIKNVNGLSVNFSCKMFDIRYFCMVLEIAGQKLQENLLILASEKNAWYKSLLVCIFCEWFCCGLEKTVIA